MSRRGKKHKLVRSYAPPAARPRRVAIDPTKPHVAWVVESGGLAGGVKVIFEFATRLAALGYRNTIVSLDARPAWFDWGNRAEVEWRSYGSYNGLIEAVKGLKIDAVIATWWKTAYTAREIAESTRCRGMYLVQDIETEYYYDPISRDAVMKTYDLGLDMFTTSRWVESRLNCFYTGLAIGAWVETPPRGGRERSVLACMRRQSLKGFRQLTEVVRYLNKQSVALVTFGQDKDIEFHQWHKHVHRPDNATLQKMYSSCGVFISTSLHEGFSMTPLEAMACGAAVVCFDAAGNMEYVEDGQNCLVASDPADMAALTIELLKNPERRANLGDAGKETARKYADWRGPVAMLASFLDSP